VDGKNIDIERHIINQTHLPCIPAKAGIYPAFHSGARSESVAK